MVYTLLLLPFLILTGAADGRAAAFPLLRVPTGARASAMGEAYTALADDAGALFWNPAGLGRITRVHLNFSHHEWFGETRDEQFAGTLPLGPGFIGVGAVHSSVRGIELRDPENNPGGTATAQSGYAVAGYGFSPAERFFLGASLKGLYDILIDETGYGFAADIGLIYRPVRWFSIAVTGKDLGPGIWYEGTRWPVSARAGIGLCLQFERFRALADAGYDLTESPRVHLGGEYEINPFLTVRAGARLGAHDHRTLGWTSMLTSGLGLRYEHFALDYALVPYGPLGITHRFALNLAFRADIYGSVTVEVREAGTGQPVEAHLTPEWVHQGRSQTGPDGTFRIHGVEPGWLKLTADADGYLPASDSLLIEPHRNHRILLTMHKAGYGSLWGATYCRATGRALAALVICRGPVTDSLHTGSDEGSFTFRRLPAGKYSLAVLPTAQNYARTDTAVFIEAGRLTSITLRFERAAAENETDIETGHQAEMHTGRDFPPFDDSDEYVPAKDENPADSSSDPPAP